MRKGFPFDLNQIKGEWAVHLQWMCITAFIAFLLVLLIIRAILLEKENSF